MESGSIFYAFAAVAPGADVKNNTATILAFPCVSTSTTRRALRNDFVEALRSCESPVVIDFSGCNSLNHDDIELLLECSGRVAGRDRDLRLAAGSRVIQVLLEVTRISLVVPVFNSVEEALAIVQIPRKSFEDGRPSQGTGVEI